MAATGRASFQLSSVCQRAVSRAAQKQCLRYSANIRSISNWRFRSIHQPRSHHLRTIPQGTTIQLRHKSENTTSSSHELDDSSAATKSYTFSDITKFVASPAPDRILIDVREPSELQESGRIPGAKNMPINSSPDGLFLPADDFEEKFGWDKPRSTDEVVFYCKAGVRSHAAMKLAQTAGWKQVSEYPGSWLDWVKNGGKIEH